MSALPPDMTTATRLPRMASPSLSNAANGAAPAGSAKLWVSRSSIAWARKMAASLTVITRAAPRLMISTASATGTRVATPSAKVSAALVLPGLPAAKDNA